MRARSSSMRARVAAFGTRGAGAAACRVGVDVAGRAGGAARSGVGAGVAAGAGGGGGATATFFVQLTAVNSAAAASAIRAPRRGSFIVDSSSNLIHIPFLTRRPSCWDRILSHSCLYYTETGGEILSERLTRRWPPWLALSFGFGGLLVCVLAAGAGTLVELDQVRNVETQSRKAFLERLSDLDQIRARIYLSGTY